MLPHSLSSQFPDLWRWADVIDDGDHRNLEGRKVRSELRSHIIKSVFVHKLGPNILSQQWETRLDYRKKSWELKSGKNMGALQMENIYTKISLLGKYLKSFHEANLIFVSREIHYTFCDHQFSRPGSDKTWVWHTEIIYCLIWIWQSDTSREMLYCCAVKRTLPNVSQM